MRSMLAALMVFAVVGVCGSQAEAMRADHGYVKELLEARFGLIHREVGMSSVTIPSDDCRIRIVDGSTSAKAGGDQAAFQVVKGEKSVSFFISDKMSYDVILGSIMDFTSQKRGGLVTHATLLKVGANKLVITKLSLYPNDENAEPTTVIACTVK